MRKEISAKDLHVSARRRAAHVAVCVVILASIASVVSAERQVTDEVVVIVHPQNASGSLSKEFLRQAFLKQVTRWEDDETIRPVDLPASSGARRRFSEHILGRSVEAVKSYWQQRIFSGRDIPPPELTSDEAVVGYVKEHPGAIGYVSSGAELRAAKVVAVIR